jgi:hypothetical protein
MMNLKPPIHQILEDYALPWHARPAWTATTGRRADGEMILLSRNTEVSLEVL